MKLYLQVLLISISVNFQVCLAQNNELHQKKSIWVKSQKKNLNDSLNKKEIKSIDYFNYNKIESLSKLYPNRLQKNIIGNQSSLFLVYRGDDKEETELLNIKNKKFNASISSKKIEFDKEIEINKGLPSKGMIISLLFDKNTGSFKKKGSINISDGFYNEKDNNNQLAELIYIPRFLNPRERLKIESYLSIKYGISLIEETDYVNSRGEKIWDKKKNKEYSKNITGVGRDDFYELNQSHSKNSLNDGVDFELAKNHSIKNNTFLLWGDNGKKVLFKKSLNNFFSSLEKIWKIQTFSKSEEQKEITTKLTFNKKEIGLESDVLNENENYWLAIDSISENNINYSNSKYIKISSNNKDDLVFTNLKWTTNSSYYFSVVKAKDFSIIANAFTECNKQIKDNGVLKVNLIGGMAPYKITIQTNGFLKEFSTEESSFELTNLKKGDYFISVRDQKNTPITTSTSIDFYHTEFAQMEGEYYLDKNNEITISPTILKENEIIEYQWYHDDVLISENESILVNTTGKYSLSVTQKSGCKSDFSFEVRNKNTKIGNSKWSLYPNPVIYGQNFNLEFNLEKESNTTVSIHDLSGKLIKSFNLGFIKSYILTYNKLPEGTYLISISIDGKIESTKLIIK